MWRPLVGMLLFFVFIVALFGYRLDSLAPGISQDERITINSSNGWHSINVVYAPYKAAQFGITKVRDSIFAHRLVSVIIGTLASLSFYSLSKRFFNPYIAVLATILFTTSSLVMYASRSAGFYVMLLATTILVDLGYKLRFNDKKSGLWLLLCLTASLSLAVPGLIFFLLAFAIWQRRSLREQFKAIKQPYLIGGLILLFIAVIAIIWGIVLNPSIWKIYLGLPTFNLKQLGHNLVSIPVSLIAYSPSKPEYWLGHQPILDVFSLIMFALGSYSLVIKRKLDRSLLLGGWLGIGILWATLSGEFRNLVVILPAVYLAVGFGIQFLIRRWFKVFPNNPLARSVGTILMTIAVLSAVSFQLGRYYVAWPHNPDTIKAYRSTANLIQ